MDLESGDSIQKYYMLAALERYMKKTGLTQFWQ
jgi:hypothetical protein